MRVHCPAKVNLHLEVGARRADGFHELATIFQAIGLWDILEAELAERLEFACEGTDLPIGDANLVVRAAKVIQARYGLGARGARMSLRKTIPVGAGLGGGSSDAAGALVLLTRLWGVQPAPGDLEELAGELGSDVAFFLGGGTAVGTGRGERIAAAAPFSGPSIVLGLAPFPIATAEVYRRLAAHRDRGAPALTPPAFGVNLRGLLTKLVREKDFGAARNDLEPVVLVGWPELAEYRQSLTEAGARLALVSGSGSSVFGVFDREDEALAACVRLAGYRPRWRSLVVPLVASGVRLEA